MNPEEKEAVIQKLKRELIDLPAESVSLQYGKPDIYNIIPHRPPFDFIIEITALNLAAEIIEVKSTVATDHPVFAGHFPGEPVYPGVYQIETMGQAGLCLAYFIKNKTDQISVDNYPVKGLFTRVHNAGFIKAVKPGDVLTIRARLIEDDDFFGIIGAQILIKKEIIAHSILEVYYP